MLLPECTSSHSDAFLHRRRTAGTNSSNVTARWQQQTVCEFEYVEYGGEQQQSQTLKLQSALISQEKSTA